MARLRSLLMGYCALVLAWYSVTCKRDSNALFRMYHEYMLFSLSSTKTAMESCLGLSWEAGATLTIWREDRERIQFEKS